MVIESVIIIVIEFYAYCWRHSIHWACVQQDWKQWINDLICSRIMIVTVMIVKIKFEFHWYYWKKRILTTERKINRTSVAIAEHTKTLTMQVGMNQIIKYFNNRTFQNLEGTEKKYFHFLLISTQFLLCCPTS
jgi:hypothetical protein